VSRRVVIAGASGFMGAHFVEYFRESGAEVATIGRSATRSGQAARWGQTAAITDLLEGADLLVNLAGKSVNCRYNESNRAEILRSRVDTTAELAEAIRACDVPPTLWVNSSTATIYRHAEDRPMGESDGELGEGFSVEVARAWESAFFAGELPGTRRVALRSAIVLGRGGALTPMLRLARLGLGGPQFDGHWIPTRARLAAGTFHRFRARGGRQKFSWIHIDDVLGIIEFLQDRGDLDGVFNAAAPNPTDNRTLMRSIRTVLGIPAGLPAFRWMTELGAIGIRTETELILKSRWVVPERLSAAGFSFEYPDLEQALRQIAGSHKSWH
jgi:Predicted nucleoside-diphosphate sugar epimerase